MSYRTGVPVDIPETKAVGWLYIGLFSSIILYLIPNQLGDTIVSWTIAITLISLQCYLFAKIHEAFSKAGPAHAGFHRGITRALVDVDGEDLVVNPSKGVAGPQAYKPTRIEWKTPRSFSIAEKDTVFELVFSNPSEATSFAGRMKASMRGITEILMPSVTSRPI